MINAGTNNANRGESADIAYDEMDDILQAIWNYDEAMKDTCIILSTLLPTTNANGKINRITMNNQYRKLVDDYKGERCIYLADMEPTGEGSDYISVDGPYWSDPTHPNVSSDQSRLGHGRVLTVDRTKDTSGWATSSTPPSTAPYPRSSRPPPWTRSLRLSATRSMATAFMLVSSCVHVLVSVDNTMLTMGL